MRRGIKASVFLAARTDLLLALRDIDGEIDQAIKNTKSARAFERAKDLFAARGRVARKLKEFGIDVEDHPAVVAHETT